jgi:hypothetical protein
LEGADYVDDNAAPDAGAAGAPVAVEEVPAAPDADANVFAISLHALAGIHTENSMLLPVMVKGERLLALLDTGSTHSFMHGTTMRRLGLVLSGGDQLRVIVANGDRLRCEGVVRNVPISIEGEHFSITCVGLDLGCFNFILDVDYLRTLGPIMWDLEAMTMAFTHKGRRIL